MTKWTLETARARLEQEIREAETRYAKRVANINEEPESAKRGSRSVAIARWARAKALYDSGLNYSEVGKKLGVTGQRARAMCLKLEQQQS
jgi:hypothetical protein